MGKAKRRKLETGKPRKGPGNSKPKVPPPKPKAKPNSQKPEAPKQHSEPTIPFDPNDRILLVGEGDFSFSASLITHHGCADVLATCYDSEAELLQKYPQAATHIATLEENGQRVMYGVDATKLPQKEIRKGRAWDRILFNFPHVGGKSTDVNRQVRYNQELLVTFFQRAQPLLSPAGTIVVTLFEGEPYTLWNVRDLARHVGLKVVRSFKFQAGAYPGYKHARTLGNVEGAGGAWKGEERLARTYVFEAGEKKKKKEKEKEKEDGEDETGEMPKGKRKRAKGDESSSDEED